MRIGLDALGFKSVDRVPEAYTPVLRASTGDEKAFLVRRPSQGFDCGLVGAKLPERIRSALGVRGPDHEFIIITARCELHIVVRPFEAANLLFMASPDRDGILFAPQVVVLYCSIFGP